MPPFPRISPELCSLPPAAPTQTLLFPPTQKYHDLSYSPPLLCYLLILVRSISVYCITISLPPFAIYKFFQFRLTIAPSRDFFRNQYESGTRHYAGYIFDQQMISFLCSTFETGFCPLIALYHCQEV
jgi:hypothetical protein